MSIHRFSARILAAALACGFPIGGWADDRADFEQLMTAAHEARKKAASVGSEWRDIGKFLKQAEQAATKGDLATARKLAIKARRQGELGYEQAMSQRDADFPAYMIASSGRKPPTPATRTPAEKRGRGAQ